MNIQQLFFELIQVAIGTRICLSHTPNADEWGELYAMAKKQSLVGVCFAGVQRLQLQQQCPEEMLFLSWMGMAAKIQQRNEVVNRQCVELQAKLSADGFQSCILKGQGVAASYTSTGSAQVESLSLLRQSGDIDLWVDGDIKDTISRFKQMGIELTNINIKHADAWIFDDTEVEIHFRPSWFYSPVKDYKLRKWFEEQKVIQMNHRVGDLYAPTTEFNLVYLLLHTYRHMLDEGVGLRQLMDYYFTLLSVPEDFNVSKVQSVLKSLGLMKFASTVMWIMKSVFSLPAELLICEFNEKLGMKLLEDVMKAGNFGHGDNDRAAYSNNAWTRGLNNFNRNMRYLSFYPSEVLWVPFWKSWHWCWRRKMYKD